MSFIIMSTYEFIYIGTLVSLCWIRTLGRVVEQLAGCLVKLTKSQQSRSKSYNASAKMSYEYLCNYFNPVTISTPWSVLGMELHVSMQMPIAPPTRCGIQPVPNRNFLKNSHSPAWLRIPKLSEKPGILYLVLRVASFPGPAQLFIACSTEKR